MCFSPSSSPSLCPRRALQPLTRFSWAWVLLPSFSIQPLQHILTKDWFWPPCQEPPWLTEQGPGTWECPCRLSTFRSIVFFLLSQFHQWLLCDHALPFSRVPSFLLWNVSSLWFPVIYCHPSKYRIGITFSWKIFVRSLAESGMSLIKGLLKGLNKIIHKSREWLPKAEGRGKWGVDVQWVKSFSYERWISSRDLMYNIVPLVNNTVLCTWRFI